jgi:site-specific DNA-methyltransferase (adenine-specific)
MHNEVLNCDCMEYMATVPDNWFELAIVDPPYGIGINGKVGGRKCAPVSEYKNKGWDKKPPKKEYFDELKRVSKNQIIWGGNYFLFALNETPCFVVWDKDNTGNFADCELACNSFDTATRLFKFRWNGMLQGNMKKKEIRIHETQKPVALYKWLLKNYAKQGDKILDTHIGSGSIRIACHDMGFGLWGCELDPDYWQAQEERFKRHIQQEELFTFEGGEII